MATVVCYLITLALMYLSFMISDITPQFSDHTTNIGVMENNEVTLPKPRTKDIQELA
jgi:hypothetical protein